MADSWRFGKVSILAAVIGGFFTLAVAFVPWAIDRFSPEHSLEFTTVGPITHGVGLAFAITVRNTGRATQRNVELWLPLYGYSTSFTETTEDGRSVTKRTKPLLYVDASIVPTSTRETDKNHVVTFGVLRPNEEVTFTAIGVGDFLLSEWLLKSPRVVSDETVGVNSNLDKFDVEMYRGAAWLLGALVLLYLVYAVYFEHFMPKQTKRTLLLRELDKIDNKI